MHFNIMVRTRILIRDSYFYFLIISALFNCCLIVYDYFILLLIRYTKWHTLDTRTESTETARHLSQPYTLFCSYLNDRFNVLLNVRCDIAQ